MNNLNKTYPYILIVGSIIGLLASFLLTIDTIKLIENPKTDLPCNLNPFVSCTSVAASWQGAVFGFPNSLLGIIAFSMLFAVGVMLLSGGRSRKPFWLLVNLGSLAAIIFVLWFFYQSVYRIGSLCIYCMVVWAVTWPIFLYTTIWNFKENHFLLNEHRRTLLFFRPHHQKLINKIMNFVTQNHLPILLLWYVLVIMAILSNFREFFLN
jgi:uncharacterized membrane protein